MEVHRVLEVHPILRDQLEAEQVAACPILQDHQVEADQADRAGQAEERPILRDHQAEERPILRDHQVEGHPILRDLLVEVGQVDQVDQVEGHPILQDLLKALDPILLDLVEADCSPSCHRNQKLC